MSDHSESTRPPVTRRRGFQFAELMFALAVATLPMIAIVSLIHQNVTGARFNVEQATARQALVDLTELLLGESMDSLRTTASQGKQSRLNEVLKTRIQRLPKLAQDQYNSQVRDLMGKFQCTVDEDVGGVKGLAKLTLSVQLARTTVKVARYFRPDARLKPMTSAAPGTQTLNK